MAVIAVASTKGGVGKTTVCQTIGADLALDGYKVALLDADRAQNLVKWGQNAELKGVYFVSEVDSTNVVATIRSFRESYDFVFVDLPGAAETVVTYAIGRSDLVILPAQPDEKDARAAVGILQVIRQSEELLSDMLKRDVVIPSCGLITKVHNLHTRAAAHTRAVMEEAGISVLDPELIERTVFHEMSYHYRVPRQINARSGASQNVTAIKRALLTRLRQLEVDIPEPGAVTDLAPTQSAAAEEIAG